ncbi:MAG: GspH/FimT family protein [Acidobacteria bacterium]|nr:GspH/FimT family protein [Acidobacteriota bacterium]
MRISPLGESLSRSRRDSNGFTLLELLVVLILLAASAAVVMPSLTRGMQGIELEASARDLVTRLKQARSQSISTQKTVRMILRERDYVLASEYGEELKKYSLPSEISIELDKGELPLTLSFYPNGRSHSSEFEVKNSEGRALSVTVDPVTGLASVTKKQDL